MAKYVCPVCGYVHEGDEAPEKCPQCGVPGSKFIKKEENEGGLVFACEHEVGVAKSVTDTEIIEGLKANFSGECTEVGMYLAMAVPGSSFFKESENRYIRLHFAKKNDTLNEALNRLADMRKKIKPRG